MAGLWPPVSMCLDKCYVPASYLVEERPLCKRRLSGPGGPGRAGIHPFIGLPEPRPHDSSRIYEWEEEKKKKKPNIYFHSLLPTPCLPSRRARPTQSVAEGDVGACENGCKSGWRLYYLYTPGLQDKEGRSESLPPFCSPSVAPIRSSVALISLPPPPRAGRCGGGSRLCGEQRRQGPAADVRASAPVNEQQPPLGDCSGNEAADVIASCWTRGGGAVQASTSLA